MLFKDKNETGYPDRRISSPSTQDRRYLPRWEVDSKILLRIGDNAVENECRSKDINCAGTCIRTAEKINPNQLLDLTIHLSDDVQPIHARGKAVWSRAQGESNLVGVHFDRIKANDQDLIFQYAFEYKRTDVMRNWFKGF
ncbi:MAG TPA: PilZ domain-containing protein [Candidatus Omnitrophota bacterium]|nr:PilZ domain-containing protein [Candidatus Omnitrophota bacterium]HPD85286.1 PilZ domain-containing protein [Candidatus Omnitrophota bacterium]HRZ04213.1 PilZ domain-containing protein [Candidatus Omnitrophota bacterium]